jgi:peptidylprolyl isomerase
MQAETRQRILFWALMALGLAVVVIGGLWPADDDGAPEPLAADGAKLEITVEGEANGQIVVQLLPEVAPRNVARLIELARAGAYDGVVFHRVIDGFMAQTGDVEYGLVGGDLRLAGRGGSDLPDLPLEPSQIPFERGVVGMARTAEPDSANSQFFIMFAASPNLNGQYTVVGQVIEGFDVLDAIKRGTGPNGAVAENPDVMTQVRVIE